MKRIVLYFLFLLILLLEITFVHSNPYVFNEFNHGDKNNNILNPSDSNNQRRDDNKQQILYSTELEPEVIEEEPVIFDLSAQVAKFIIYFIKKYCKNNDETAKLEHLLETKGIGSIFRTNGAGKIQPNYGHLENNNKQKNHNNNNSPRMRIENTKPKPKANEIGQQHNFDTAPNYKLQSLTTKPIQPDATKKSLRKEISPKQNQIKLTKQYQVPIPQNDYADVDYDYEYEIHDPTKINIQSPQVNQVNQNLYTIPRIQYVHVKPQQFEPQPPPMPRDMMYEYEPTYEYASHPDEYGIRSNEYSLPEYDYQLIQEPPKTYYMEKEVPSVQPKQIPGFWDQLITYITPAPDKPDTPKMITEEPIATATTESQRKFETTGTQEFPAFTERPRSQSTWPQTSGATQKPGFFDKLLKYIEPSGEDEQIDRRTSTPIRESQDPEFTTPGQRKSTPGLLDFLDDLPTIPAIDRYTGKRLHDVTTEQPEFISSTIPSEYQNFHLTNAPRQPQPRYRTSNWDKTTINRRVPETTTEQPKLISSTIPGQQSTPSLLDELMAFFETSPPVTTIQYKDDTTINRRVPESTTEQPGYSWTTPIYNIIKYFEDPSEQPEQPITEHAWTQYEPEITTVLTEAPIRKQTLPSYDSYEVPQESVITDYTFPHYKNEHTSWPAHQQQQQQPHQHQYKHKKPEGHVNYQAPESNFEYSVWPSYKKQPNHEGGLRARPDFGSGYGYEVTQNFRPTTKAPNHYADRIYSIYMNEIKNLDNMSPNYKLALSGPKYDNFVDNINKMKHILLEWKNGGNFYDQPKIKDVTKQMTKLSGDNLKILGADSKEDDGDDGVNARRTFDGPEKIEEYLKDNNNADDFLTLDNQLRKMIISYVDRKDKPLSDEQLYLYLFNIKEQMEKYKTLFANLDWVDGELEKIPHKYMNKPEIARTWYKVMRKLYLEGYYKTPDFNVGQDGSKLFMTIMNLPADKIKALIYSILPSLREFSSMPEPVKIYFGKHRDIDKTPYFHKLDKYAIPLTTLINEQKLSEGSRRIFADKIEINTEQEPETTTEAVVEVTTQPAIPVRNIQKHNNVFREFLMNSDE